MADPSTKPSAAEITLEPATPADVPALAALSRATFEGDTHTELKALVRDSGSFSAFEDGMRGAFESWIAHPKVDVIVARAAGAAEPVGFIAWGRRGFAGDVDLPLDLEEAEPVEDGGGTVAQLEARTNANMRNWMARLMPAGCRCRYICATSVAPDWQSRGIGSRLIRWGTERADAELGVYCWVQSSMGGWPAFAKQGFEEVGRLELDLDKYAEGKKNPKPSVGSGRSGGEGDQGRWGNYVWRYMQREARA